MKNLEFQISNLKSSAPPARRTLGAALCLMLAALLPAASARASAWERQRTGTFAWLHSVFFVDERKGWAVGGKGALLATTDGGTTWEVRRPPTEDALRDLFFTADGTGWIVCERSMFKPMLKEESVSYLLKSTDGGGSWSRVEVTRGADVDLKLARVFFADGEHGWVFGELGALFATSDGGAHWERQRVPTLHRLLGATFLDARTGWLVGAGGTLLRTEDGGATWRAGEVGAAHAGQAPRGDGRVLEMRAAPHPAAAVDARSTRVGGARPRLNAVSFAGARRGWAVGAAGLVLATTDGGRTWRAQASGTESNLSDVKFFDEREGWAIGADGVALHTTDGGAHWRIVRTGTPHALERLFFVGRARGWAVGFGGTVVAFKG